MNPTIVYGLGTVMIIVGLVFLRMLHTGRKPDVPRDFMEWAGTVLSVLLILVAVTLMVFGQPSEPDVAEIRQQVATAGSYQDVKFELPMPDFTFTDVHTGQEDRLSRYAGKVIVINFWATWCAPCLDEIPDLNRLQREYPEDLAVISISDEEQALLQTFEQQLALETQSRFVPFGAELPQPFTGAFVIRPATFVVDREGMVRRYLLGARDYDFFKGVVEPLIANAG